MFIALGFLLGLVSLCPVILTFDGPILPCIIPLLAAAGLIAAGLSLPAAEAQRFGRLVKVFAIAASIPAIYMLLQMLPLPMWRTQPLASISALAHPVWASVAAGFRDGVSGSITADVGATAMALVRYLSLVGVALLTAAVAINRDHAESVLVSLTAAVVLISFSVAVNDLFGLSFIPARDDALDCACLGVILSAACGVLVFERHETRRSKIGKRDRRFLTAAIASAVAFAICAIAIFASRSGSILFAAGCGFGMFAGIIIVRRFDLGRMGAGALSLTASIIAIVLVTGTAGNSSDPRLAFVKKDAAAIELTQRILADAPVLGDGAGTFSSVAPIYTTSAGYASSAGTDIRAVTAAAKLSIEMGKPAVWAAMLAAALGTLYFLRAAANRGRDSFYPAVGAASLVTFMILAFINVGLFGPAVSLLQSSVIGLALAQSQSRQPK